LMVNHDLQLHVKCFKFEGVIISYKWTNGLLMCIWMTLIAPSIDHKPQKFLQPTTISTKSSFLSHCIYFNTQHWLQIQIPTTPHGLLICQLQTIHYNVGIQLLKQVYKMNKQHGFLWEQQTNDMCFSFATNASTSYSIEKKNLY
jgi:hypothetical protein